MIDFGPAEGFKKLIVWQNAAKLRKIVYDITKDFHKNEYRRISQMRDSARSVKQNIQEGYKKHSLGEYIRHLDIACGSLGELAGDIDDSCEDQLITQSEHKKLKELCGKTDYLLNRLIDSLRKKQKDGSWKKYPERKGEKGCF